MRFCRDSVHRSIDLSVLQRRLPVRGIRSIAKCLTLVLVLGVEESEENSWQQFLWGLHRKICQEFSSLTHTPKYNISEIFWIKNTIPRSKKEKKDRDVLFRG